MQPCWSAWSAPAGLAKSTKIAAQADARADETVLEAPEAKEKAEYKVAAEKCDAPAGAARDDGIKAAKIQFEE